jgi:hypothetical protein
MCELCHRRGASCFCLNCHIIDPNTGVITDSHRFNPNSGVAEDWRCPQCGLCTRHCTAVACECGTKQHGLCEVCNKCRGCCVCYFCTGSTPRHLVEGGRDNACLDCGRCDEHCSCPRCSTCNNKGRGRCQLCGKCKICCTAEDSECWAFGRFEYIPFEKRELKFGLATRKELRRLPNSRYISLEIEVNNIMDPKKPRRLQEALKKWSDSVVSDGSIGSGFEINMSPTGGDLFLDHLKELTDGLTNIKARPNDQCGVHCHVDASDFSVWDLNKVVQLYAKVERALFDICHPRRLGNTYCKPCSREYLSGGVLTNPAEFKSKLVGRLYNSGRPSTFNAKNYLTVNYGIRPENITKDHAQLIKKGAQGFVENLKRKKKHKYEDVRYLAMNLHSYFLRGKEVMIGRNKTFVGGTIEFRHHQQAVDYEELAGWGQVCQELVSAAARMTQSQIIALPRNSRRNLIALMPQRLHPYIIDRWHKHDELLVGNAEWRMKWESQWGTKITTIPERKAA